MTQRTLQSVQHTRARTPALEISDLTKWYHKTCAVDQLSMSVAPGEVVGFVGPNGAGKSTTLRILMGLVTATSGTARLLGQDALTGNPSARSDVGYLPGTPALYTRLTSRECLQFLQRVRGKDTNTRMLDLAARLDVDLDKHIHDLSRGNKQKTALIAALMHQPRVILLDEPTSGLDPLVQREVESIIREEAARGAGVLLSSHVLSEVEALADRVVMLHQGRKILESAMSDITGRIIQRLSFEFSVDADAQWFSGVAGLEIIATHGRYIECAISGSQAHALSVAAENNVVAVHTHEQRLEDVFTELIPERAA